MGLSLLSFLGGNDDNAGHGTRTIDGCGRTVFQYLKALDVVGVKSGDSRRDKRFGVSRCQIVSSHVGCIFHDNAVDHPQGLAAAVDRGCSAHAYLRGSTKRSAYVLHGHACCLPFERATDVGHTAQSGFLGIHFVGSTGKQAAVCSGKTRYHHFVKHLGVCF